MPPGRPTPGDPVSREKGPAIAPSQASTAPDVLEVTWKSLKHDNYFVLHTNDGKAAGWASRELQHDGRERFRYGVGGVKDEAKSMVLARLHVIGLLRQECLKVGVQLRVLNVSRRDG